MQILKLIETHLSIYLERNLLFYFYFVFQGYLS